MYNDECEKCVLLAELYEQTPKTPRDYWVMTELFVLLHDGADVCKPPDITLADIFGEMTRRWKSKVDPWMLTGNGTKEVKPMPKKWRKENDHSCKQIT